MNRRKCELCGSIESSLFLEAGGLDLIPGRSFRLVKCKSCHLIYLDEPIDKDWLSEIDSKEFHGSTAPLLSGSYHFIMDILMNMRVKKIDKAKKGTSIIDVGCGNGMFLMKMFKRGWDCYGLDISPYAFGSAPMKERIRLFCSDIRTADLPENYFDVATFWQSFEHICEPVRVLNKARSILKDGGVLFISAPNIESFEAKISMKRWIGMELPTHLYQYSPKTITLLLEKAGFRIISIKKNSLEYNFPFFALTVFNALGGEFNLLHKLFKRYKAKERVSILLRLYTIFLMIALLPLIIPLTFIMYIINVIFRNGPILEVFAEKKALINPGSG